MEVEYKILLTIESVVKDVREFPALEVTDFIKLIPRREVIRSGWAIANYTEDDDIRVQLDTLKFSEGAKNFVTDILATKQFDAKYILCKPQTGLELLKYVFSIPKEDHISDGEGETWNDFPLLFAILSINSILTANNAHWDKSILRSSKIIRSRGYEIDDRVPIYATIFRMFCLLHFFEQNNDNQWSILEKALTKDLRAQSLRDYIKTVLKVLNYLTFGPKSDFQIFRTDSDDAIYHNLLKLLSIGVDDVILLKDNQDYTYFKTHPVVQFSSNEYGFINNIFVANQLYTSLKFRMSTICKKSNIFKNFLALFNKAFVEKYLLNEVLRYAFIQNREVVYLNEDACESRIIEYNDTHNSNFSTDGLPDAYIRRNNKILLIECKGKTVSSNAIEDENIFIEDVNEDIVGEKKGTGQIISYCTRVINGGFVCDNDIPTNYMIYPLIVVDDPKLCSDGVNRYVIQRTGEYVRQNIEHIHPFTVIDIDTLILIIELIKNSELDIYEQIEQYHTYIAGKQENYSLNEILYYSDISFAAYIMDKFETRSPAIIDDWFKNLQD